MHDEDRVIAGRYRVTSRLGSGGMGVVWLGYDERLRRQVALKELTLPAVLEGRRGAEANRLAMREGRMAARLHHPNLVSVYDVVEADGQAYLIMEYAPATSLSRVLAERGTLPPAEVAGLGAQAAAGLAAAHEGGVVHRDVKPGNVLLGADGTVKITDFGVSRAIEDFTATTTGMIAGTPAYLAPEVARGEPATFASDVFSLGATLYAAVEGAPPFGSDDNTMAVLFRVASARMQPMTRAGPLTGILGRMLSADPGRRPTMTEARDALAALAAPAGPAGLATDEVATDEVVPDTVALAPVPARNRRRRAVPIAAAVVLLALVGTLLAVTLNGDDPDPGAAAPPASTAPPPTSATTAPPPTTTPSSSDARPTSQPPAAPASPLPPAPVQAPPQPASPPEVITAYYALMPGNLQQAWTWLTPKYQASPAGGYGGYQTFWGRIRTVRVSDVTARGETTVEAMVEYAFHDGRVVRERHRYTLVRQDGRWKIDESSVLSSVTL